MTRSVLLASRCAATLGAEERIDTTANRAVRDEGLQRSRVMETARWLTDGYGPRLAGSAEYAAAARFARQRLTECGASNARLTAVDDSRRRSLRRVAPRWGDVAHHALSRCE